MSLLRSATLSGLEPTAGHRGPQPTTTTNRILFVDAFDSFSNNIVGLLERDLGAAVTVVRIDDRGEAAADLASYVRGFDAVVVGPGPGHPANPEDVGLIERLWSLPRDALRPVFGICLGFQSLALAHGARVDRLRAPRHGIVTPSTHRGADIFRGIPGDVEATQYHSLRVRLDHLSHGQSASSSSSSSAITSSAAPPPGAFWEPTAECPDLLPLAWDLTDAAGAPGGADGGDGAILMAVRHVEKPFWGVQFHPESICTSQEGRGLLRSWWAEARAWNAAAAAAAPSRSIPSSPSPSPSPSPSLLGGAWDHHCSALASEGGRRPSHLSAASTRAASETGAESESELSDGDASSVTTAEDDDGESEAEGDPAFRKQQQKQSQVAEEGEATTPVSYIARELQSILGADKPLLRWAKHEYPVAAAGQQEQQQQLAQLDVVAVCERLGLERDEIVVLDSQGHKSGRFGIVGVTVPGRTPKVTYRSHSRTLQCRSGSGVDVEYSAALGSVDEVWPMLQEALALFDPTPHQRPAPTRAGAPPRGGGRSRAAQGPPPAEAQHQRQRTGMDQLVASHLPDDSPFWGGFMGYISYEAGLETIGVDLHESCAAPGRAPDVNFAFVHRSIVLDRHTGTVYVQSLSPHDWPWILDVGRAIDSLAHAHASAPASAASDRDKTNAAAPGALSPRDAARLEARLAAATISKPREREYRDKVLRCQESLAAGDSYELCLTDQTTVAVPRLGGQGLDAWSLYKKLRARNAAPFGAFVRLSGALVVSTSPERFLRWTREGRCQFRPIKGTVKKAAEGMTREKAHAILNSSKEQAENLMIVDLIRHDLSGVIGAASVEVPKLMVVEEYETVYQLVSVIEGQIPQGKKKQSQRPSLSAGEGAAAAAARGNESAPISGLDVLTASLPPGSMTGAPKKRSCEILRDIERRPRGIYSGVLGYLDVGGAGDFSVVIRTTVRGPGEATDDTESWLVGAGGAVTIQSTDEGEYLEMETKVSSALQAFQSA